MMDERASATRAPIPAKIVVEVADRHGVDEDELMAVVTAVHDDLVDGADAIHAHYVAENGENDETPENSDGSPQVVADGLAEVIFVRSARWNQMTERLDVADALQKPAKEVHADYARTLGTDERVLSERDALVMPSHVLSGLIRAGLSRRQAEVQVLRMAGRTQAEIGERLGLGTGTVKSHCHRIDTKIREATQLLELAGEDGVE